LEKKYEYDESTPERTHSWTVYTVCTPYWHKTISSYLLLYTKIISIFSALLVFVKTHVRNIFAPFEKVSHTPTHVFLFNIFFLCTFFNFYRFIDPPPSSPPPFPSRIVKNLLDEGRIRANLPWEGKRKGGGGRGDEEEGG
jgi:hypothetical protein